MNAGLWLEKRWWEMLVGESAIFKRTCGQWDTFFKFRLTAFVLGGEKSSRHKVNWKLKNRVRMVKGMFFK